MDCLAYKWKITENGLHTCLHPKHNQLIFIKRIELEFTLNLCKSKPRLLRLHVFMRVMYNLKTKYKLTFKTTETNRVL